MTNYEIKVELLKAKEYLATFDNIVDRDKLMEQFERVLSLNTDLELKNIEGLLASIQENIAKNNYLNREGALHPIDQLTPIPDIYRVLHQLIDVAVALTPEKKIWDPEYFNSDWFSEEDDDYALRRSKALQRFRVEILSKAFPASEAVQEWADNGFHCTRYPKNDGNNQRYTENQVLLDMIDVDRILEGVHYGVLNINDAVNLHGSGMQRLPNFIDVDTDYAVQFDQEKQRFNKLLPLDVTNNIPATTDNYPLRLLASQVTNCLVMLINDKQGNYCMLHVSPLAQRMQFSGGFNQAVEAYTQLIPGENNPFLKPLNGEVEVVVVVKKNVFKQDFDELQFRQFLQKKLPSVTLASLTIEYTDERFEDRSYSVCFLPEKNELHVVSADINASIPNVLNLKPEAVQPPSSPRFFNLKAAQPEPIIEVLSQPPV